jgi:hypothetical protein
MYTNIHASIGIPTHDPSVREGEDISYLRPRGHCNRPNLEKYRYNNPLGNTHAIFVRRHLIHCQIHQTGHSLLMCLISECQVTTFREIDSPKRTTRPPITFICILISTARNNAISQHQVYYWQLWKIHQWDIQGNLPQQITANTVRLVTNLRNTWTNRLLWPRHSSSG